MIGARAIVAVLVLFVGLSNCAQPTPIYEASFAVAGFDVIFANTTSFLDEVDRHRGALYTAGQGFVHQILEQPFEISMWPYFPQNHSFLDFRTFVDASNNSWAVGPIPNQQVWNDNGINYPFYLLGKDKSVVEPPPGHYLMGAVTMDVNNLHQPVAYFAGWHQHVNASEGVNFTIIRTVVNVLNAVHGLSPVFQYNHTGGDRVDLHGNGFVAFDRTFKPWMFHSFTHNHLIVVDPASNSVYRISSPVNVTEPLSYNATNGRFREFGQITGATYDSANHTVYLGIQGWGTNPGRIVALDMVTMHVIKNFTLGWLESNPKSLSLDFTGHLYVGLLGGHALLKINLHSWTISGYSTLPPFLRNVYYVSAQYQHVYFITNEQHSKVARVANANFCSTTCDDLVGHCNAGVCACPSNMQLGSDKRRCQSIPTNPNNGGDKSHGGEVALGILFAIAFVAAAIGWFLIYRIKSANGYSVIESAGLLRK